jgi:2-methylcitrate dehydratase PrpD
VVRGSAGFATVDDSALDDPDIVALRHRVHIAEDPAMNPSVPAAKPARVTVMLKDGRQATRSCDSPRGDCLNPYDPSEIRQKFRELAGLALTPQGVAEVESARWARALDERIRSDRPAAPPLSTELALELSGEY